MKTNAAGIDKSRRPLAVRFWEKVDVKGPDDCWEWKAKAKTAFGYGRMTNGRKSNLKAHRVSYMLAHGEIPADMCVCHACDNPGCCNPAHLFLGSKRDNTHDMVRKGRMSLPPVLRGEAHHFATIPDADLPLVRGSNVPSRELASRYGVSVNTINRIRSGRSRCHENQ